MLRGGEVKGNGELLLGELARAQNTSCLKRVAVCPEGRGVPNEMPVSLQILHDFVYVILGSTRRGKSPFSEGHF